MGNVGQNRRVARTQLPPSIIELYSAYRNDAADPKIAFAYDTYSEWDRGIVAVSELADQLIGAETSNGDKRLAAQEREFFEKMRVNWRGRGIGTLCIEDSAELSCHNAEQAAALMPEFRRLSDDYINRLEMMDTRITELLMTAQVRATRGKGSPFWAPGTDRVGAIAIRAIARRYNDDFYGLERACRAIAPDRPTFVQTSYIRIQGQRNYVKAWERAADGTLHVVGERMGPKVRRIAAQPFVLNHWIAPFGELLRTIMAETPLGIHAGKVEPVLEHAKGYRYLVATDLKSYDTTVSYETLRAFQQTVVNPVIDYCFRRAGQVIWSRFRFGTQHLLDDIDTRMQNMEILTPATESGRDADMWRASGQTRSGENLTSFKGTEIRKCHARLKLLECGGDPDTDLIYNYGDDTLLMTNNSELVRKWFERPTYLGLTEVAAADASFLMRRIPYGYAYMGRMVAACINREPKQEPTDVMAAASAFATRYVLLKGHPWKKHFYKLLHAYGGPERFKEAVSLAEKLTSVPEGDQLGIVVALNQVNSRLSVLRKGQPTTNEESQVSQLRSILDGYNISVPDRNAVEAAIRMHKESESRIGPIQFYKWYELDKLAADMGERAATSYLHAIVRNQRSGLNYMKGTRT